jgi:hypothetical protein
MGTTEPSPDDNDNDNLLTLEEVDDDNEQEDNDNNGGSGEEEDSKAKDEVDEAFDSLTEEEHEQLLDNMAAVWITLDKVCIVLTGWITAITNWFNYEDLQALICSCSFYYDYPPSMVCSLCHPWSTCPPNPL